MLAFGWNEKVEYTRDCCYALLDRLNMSMFQLGKSKVGIQIRVINGRETLHYIGNQKGVTRSFGKTL